MTEQMTNQEYAQKVEDRSGAMFRLDMFPMPMLAEKMLEVSDTAGGIDLFRKALFYGKGGLGFKIAGKLYQIAHPDYDTRPVVGTYLDHNGDEQDIVLSHKQQNILHAILGIATEAGKLCELFLKGMGAVQRRDHTVEDAFDKTQLLITVGEVEWYATLLLNAIDKTREECFAMNDAARATRVEEVFSGSLDEPVRRESTMLDWTITEHGAKRGATMEHLGLIPTFINSYDPRPAKEQIDDQYQHGGGWRHFDGFTLGDKNQLISKYDEPDLYPIAEARHDHEHIMFYDHAWTCIKQPDGSFEVARLD